MLDAPSSSRHGTSNAKPTVDEQRDNLAHGDFVHRHSNVPIINRTEGSLLHDTSGRIFLSAEAANGTAALGFDASIVEEGLRKVTGLPAVPSFCETDLRRRVAAKICALMFKTTGVHGRVCFDLGGAQGVELALKIARCNSASSQFVVFEGGYHGRSAYTSQFSASHRYRKAFGDWRIPLTRLPYPDCEQCRFQQRRESCSHQCLSYLDGLIANEFAGLVANRANGHGDIAAFILEPVLNAGGIVRPDKIYLEGAVQRMRDIGALVIVDEIFCGFFRTGKQWGFQHYDFIPDIVVMSKALTNGIAPLSCVWARDHLVSEDRFPPGAHSATYANYALGLAMADTVLDRFDAWENKETQIAALEGRLRQMVRTVAKTSPLVVSGYAIGGTARLLLRGPFAGKIGDVARVALEREPIEGIHGAILASTGMAPNVIAINPPLVIDLRYIDILEEILIRSMRAIK